MGQKHSVPLSVDSKPSKKKLVELIPHVAPHWYLIGIQLLREDQESLLDVIKADYGHDKVQSCTEMFCLWLKSHPNASWRQLIESLQSPAVQLHSVAADIETMLTGKHNATTASKIQGEIPQPDFYKFKNVSLAFVSLTSSVTKHLENQDFFILRRACIAQIDSPDGAKLPADVVDEIKNAENLKTLLDILTATKYWNWIDLRLLEALVVASGSTAAQDIVDKYKAAVYSKKLIEILQNAPSKEIRDAYFTKIVSKVDKNPEEVTVADLIEFRSKLETVIMQINKGTCALEHISNGSIEIHWYMPTHHIDHAYEAACLQQYKFHELHLVCLQIGNKPVIYDSQIVYSSQSVLLKPSPPVTADTSKDVIDYFYHYLSIGLNTDLIVQYLLTQHLLNDEELNNLKNASSRYQKNCLLLEKMRLMNMGKLESLCKLLQLFDSQRHIGNVLMDAFQLLGFSTVEPSPGPSRVQDPFASIDSKNAQTNLVSGRSNGKTDVSRKRRLSSEQHTGVKYFKPSSVTAEFLNVREQLEDILQGCDTQKMLVEFRGLMASEAHNIYLVSNEEYLQSLNECKFAPEMLQKLSPFFTWSDHSVLTAVVKACDNAEAESLLQQFDSQVDLSLPITEYPVPQPIPSMAPYNTSTQTVLAVKVNAKLNKFSFQQVVELRHLIQRNCEITGHSLQLLAAKSSSTILYWIIPKCIGHLINSKIMQDRSLHASRVEELSIYPGTLFVRVSNLNLGSLSFLSQINDTLTQDEHEVLSTQLSRLEQLPNVMRILQFKKGSVKESEVQKHNVMVQTESNDQFDQDQSQYKLSMMHLKESNSFLKEKIVIEKQKYSDLMGKYEELQSSISLDSEVGLLKQKIVKEKTNYSDLLRKYEDLQNSLTFGSEVQIELKNLQLTVEKVTISLEKTQLIKGDKKSKVTDLTNKGDKESEEPSNKKPLVTKLKELNSYLTTIKNWSEVIHLLQTELSDSKEKVEQLESVVDKLEARLQKYQERNHQLNNELSEMNSRLLVKEKELIKLKEDNKLLVKQFREKKQKKIREIIPQDQLIQQELIGSGRYGEVYKISYSDKLYAGKIIYKKLLPGYPHPSEINKLLGEIENASAMLVTNQHPNIEQFHSVLQVTFDSPPVLLTELLHENLNNYIARIKGKLPIHAQLDLCHDMAKGLQFLHTAGLVHNNLHGANVLISQDGQAKIADYICPLVDTLNKQTMLQHNVYTSPELIKNMKMFSKQSDIYSLGIIYLQVSTQSPPLPKDSAELSEVQRWKEQLNQITTNPIFPLILQCLGMALARPSVDRICAKLLAAKESPQSIISDTLYHIKDTTEFGVALQSGRHKLKWTKCSNLPVAIRYGKAIVINDILYIGGESCVAFYDEYYMFSYQLTDDQWTKLPILPYRYGVPINIDNQLSYTGGQDPSIGRSTNKVITLEDNKWTAKYHNMIVARLKHAAVTYQHYVIVAGGEGEDGSTLDTIEVFNCNNYQWTIVSTYLPQPMKAINATTCNQSFVIAGYNGADNSSYNGTYIITMDSLLEHQQSLTSSTSEDGYKWSELFHTPYFISTIVPNTSPPVLTGGHDEQGKTVNDIFLYDDSSDSWRAVELSPITCAGATVATIDNIIIIAGGFTDGSSMEAINATTLTSVVLGRLELCD